MELELTQFADARALAYLGGIDSRPVYPTPESLLAEATALTGLSDFGADDFRSGLAAFLTACEHEMTSSNGDVERIVALVRQRLVSRLQVEEWYRTHPETEGVLPGAVTSITVCGP